MLYRSPATRYALSVVGLFAGALLTFGDGHKWRDTPSLHWLAHAGLPLQVWGVAVMVYAVLLLWWRTRPVAYAAGAFLYAVFTVSLFATVGDGGPKNSITLAAMVGTVVFHAYSIRTAEAIRLTDHGRRP